MPTGIDREYEGITKTFHFAGFARIVFIVFLAEAVGHLDGRGLPFLPTVIPTEYQT
jgi:hypothetical protein